MTLTPEQIFNTALKAAHDAVAAEVARMPEGNHMDCGFAWVVVKPARGKFISYCKEQIEKAYLDAPSSEKRVAKSRAESTYGDKHWNGGWCFWSPAKYNGQSIRFHEAGAKAFAKVLVDNGINAFADSRYD
jgi:hypothetical protein